MRPIRPYASYPHSQPRHISPPLQRVVENPRAADISLFVDGTNSISSQIDYPPFYTPHYDALSHAFTDRKYLPNFKSSFMPLQFVRSSEQKLLRIAFERSVTSMANPFQGKREILFDK